MSLLELTRLLARFLGFSKLHTATVSRLLKRNKWSWKIPTRVQLNKFTQKNKEYYATYLCMFILIYSLLLSHS